MRDQQFDLTVQAEGELRRIILAGELDLSTAPDLASAAIEQCEAEQTCEVEIDLGAVRFIDSTGIRTLLVAANEAASRGVALYVIPSDSEHVTNVFEVTRLLDSLPWREREADEAT